MFRRAALRQETIFRFEENGARKSRRERMWRKEYSRARERKRDETGIEDRKEGKKSDCE